MVHSSCPARKGAFTHTYATKETEHVHGGLCASVFAFYGLSWSLETAYDRGTRRWTGFSEWNTRVPQNGLMTRFGAGKPCGQHVLILLKKDRQTKPTQATTKHKRDGLALAQQQQTWSAQRGCAKDKKAMVMRCLCNSLFDAHIHQNDTVQNTTICTHVPALSIHQKVWDT